MPATVPDLGANAIIAYTADEPVTILTGQTIGAGSLNVLRADRTYELIVLDRALTAEETTSVTEYLQGLMP